MNLVPWSVAFESKTASRLRRKNLKTQPYSAARPTVLNNPPRKRFPKISSNSRSIKTLALCFRVDGKHFEKRAFRRRWRHDKHVISLIEFSSNTNPRWSCSDWCVFNFRQGSVDEDLEQQWPLYNDKRLSRWVNPRYRSDSSADVTRAFSGCGGYVYMLPFVS